MPKITFDVQAVGHVAQDGERAEVSGPCAAHPFEFVVPLEPDANAAIEVLSFTNVIGHPTTI